MNIHPFLLALIVIVNPQGGHLDDDKNPSQDDKWKP